MLAQIAITDFRKLLNGLYLSEMVTPVVITVNSMPTKVVVDLPRTDLQLELIKTEIEDIYNQLQDQRRNK